MPHPLASMGGNVCPQRAQSCSYPQLLTEWTIKTPSFTVVVLTARMGLGVKEGVGVREERLTVRVTCATVEGTARTDQRDRFAGVRKATQDPHANWMLTSVRGAMHVGLGRLA